MADREKEHIVAAFRFELGELGELGKVNALAVRSRTVDELTYVNTELAQRVARGVGVPVPDGGREPGPYKSSSPALSLEAQRGDGSIRTRRIAVLVTDGVDAAQVTSAQVTSAREALAAEGAVVEAIAPADRSVTGSDGTEYRVDRALPTVAAALYDAVLVPADQGVVTDTAPGAAGDEFLRGFTRAVAEHRHRDRAPVRL